MIAKVLAFMMALSAGFALVLAFIFTGFAVWVDVYPRSVWDWYVVAMCGMHILGSYFTACELGRRIARETVERFVGTILAK